MQNHIVVDVIETGFLADWMPARKMEGREARCLATAKKVHVPGVDFPEKGKIMVHIEQAEPLKQLIPNTAVSGALSFLREKTER
nr:hypothetical protein [Lacrimispora amygdalina]